MVRLANRRTVGLAATLGALLVGLAPGTGPARAAPPSAVPGAQDPGLTLTLDRGDGATYYVGETMTVCISASRPATVRLVHTQGTAASSVIYQGQLSEQQCSSGPITPPVGTESLRLELLNDQGTVVTARTVTYQTAMRGAAGAESARTTSGRPIEEVYSDLLDPCTTVRQYAARQGLTPPLLRSDPRAQQTVQLAWPLLVPVLDEIAQNPARAEDLELLISSQVERSLRGQGAIYGPEQGRQALADIEGAAQRALEAWARGEQPEPGALLLASLWGDGQRRAAWRAAALGGTAPAPPVPTVGAAGAYPRCAI